MLLQGIVIFEKSKNRNLLIWFCLVGSSFSFGQNKNFTIEETSLYFGNLFMKIPTSISNLSLIRELKVLTDSTGVKKLILMIKT
jgi:hypothetical protein